MAYKFKKTYFFKQLILIVSVFIFLASCAITPPGISAPGSSMNASALAFSPDGTSLAMGKGFENRIIIYDFPQMKAKVKIKGNSNISFRPASSLDFSADGTRLASAWFNESVIFWNPDNGSEINRLKNTQGVQALAFLPDGRRLVTAGPGPLVRVWDTTTGEHLTDLSGHTEGVLAVACARNKPLVATAGTDRTIRLWDSNSWSQVKVLKGHLGPVLSVAFSPDGNVLASSANGVDVRLWQVGNKSGAQDWVTNIWDEISRHEKINKTMGSLNLIFATLSVATFGHPGAHGGSAALFLLGPNLPKPVFNCPVAFSPDGRLLAFILFRRQLNGDYHAIIVDVEKRKAISRYSGAAGVLLFSPDGKTLATSGAFGIKLIDPYTGKKIHSK